MEDFCQITTTALHVAPHEGGTGADRERRGGRGGVESLECLLLQAVAFLKRQYGEDESEAQGRADPPWSGCTGAVATTCEYVEV